MSRGTYLEQIAQRTAAQPHASLRPRRTTRALPPTPPDETASNTPAPAVASSRPHVAGPIPSRSAPRVDAPPETQPNAESEPSPSARIADSARSSQGGLAAGLSPSEPAPAPESPPEAA